jgi:hypothetical protein
MLNIKLRHLQLDSGFVEIEMESSDYQSEEDMKSKEVFVEEDLYSSMPTQELFKKSQRILSIF